MPDISASLAPKSDQLDNIDLRGEGPRVFTVTRVDYHPDSDQPVIVHLAEFDRPWKPGKNMRRVLSHCWGRNTDDWPKGAQVELYADESVKFGNDTPGGTRISRVSHIDGPTSAAIMLGQGRAGVWKVKPLPRQKPTAERTQPEPTAEEVAACVDKAELGAMWKRSGKEMRATIEARVADLDNEPEPGQ